MRALSRFQKRFGLLQAIFLGLSTVGILAIALLLIAFWVYCNAEDLSEKTGLWTYLILENWVSRFITVSTAALWFCVSAQVLLACLMLASLALEHQLVRDDDFSMMSIYQYSNGGPLDLAWPLTRGLRWGVGILGLLAVLLLAGEGTAIQLSSTILLSDLKAVVLRDTVSPINGTLKYSFSDSFYAMEEPSTVMKANPVEYPLFAEKAEDRIVVSDSNTTQGLVDSGHVLRALFPLNETERATLASYQGVARIISTHSICFAPQINDFTVNFDNSTILYDNTTLEVYFEALMDNLTPGNSTRDLLARGSLVFNETDRWSALDCGLKLKRDVLNVDMQSKFLPLNVTDEFPVTHLSNGKIDWQIVAFPTWPNNLDTAVISATVKEALNDTSTIQQSYNGSEWTTLTFPPVPGDDRPSFQIHTSVCGTDYEWASADIEVSAAKNLSDAHLSLTKDLTGQFIIKYVTSAVQKQMGVDRASVTRPSNEERGILELSSWIRNNDHDLNTFSWFVGTPASGDLMTIEARSGYGSEYGWLHPVAEALFMNTLADTKQLSLAWEAIAMALFDAHYTQNLDFFDVGGNVTMRMFKQFMVPRQYTGLYAVLSVLGLHFLVMLSVLSTYFRSRSWKDWVPEDFKYLLGTTEKSSGKLSN
jgi:hypothetical protein